MKHLNISNRFSIQVSIRSTVWTFKESDPLEFGYRFILSVKNENIISLRQRTPLTYRDSLLALQDRAAVLPLVDAPAGRVTLNWLISLHEQLLGLLVPQKLWNFILKGNSTLLNRILPVFKRKAVNSIGIINRRKENSFFIRISNNLHIISYYGELIVTLWMWVVRVRNWNCENVWYATDINN